MALSLTHTFADGGVITASEINDNFTDVQNKFAGGITNADLSASAGIALSKIASTKQHAYLTLNLNGGLGS